MSASEMMTGPDGTPVRAFRRGMRQIGAGDWLPELAGHAVGTPIQDPDTGHWWVTLEDGRDVEVRTRKAWVHRVYDAPAWMADALAAYRCARDAREALRESGAPAPTDVPGIAGSQVAWCQLERETFDAVCPAPRLADFIRDAAAAYRDGRERVDA